MQTSPQNQVVNSKSRIQSHGEGAGPPTPEALERRARENATIEGRTADEVAEDNRVLAARELHDQALSLSAHEKRSDVVASSNPADVAVDTGHEVKSLKSADEQQIEEIEVKEGVREAEHERMLKGRRANEEKMPEQ